MFKQGITLLFVLVLCAMAAPAQFDTATVLGTVRDPSQAVVSGATVTLLNIATGIRSTTTSDENGNYQFLTVKVGVYKVTAEMQGFSTAVADRVNVTINARQRVDLEMKVGAVSEIVEVSGAVQQLETDSSDRGQVIHAQQIVQLPLNGRNYSDLALLTTGIRRSSYAFANPPREGAFNANGQRSTFNNFLLDGVDNNAYGTSNQGFSNQVVQLPPDAVTEFKVVTNNMSAEYGRTSGAVINASMRSGTNDFHGSAWEFVRNTSLNAVGFFKPATGKPVLQRNQFGFVFGGPIVRNRAFFFTDYEGFRENNKFLVLSSLPTANDRRGIFDRAVRNPLTGQTFDANTPLPESAMTPFARRVLADLPLPNRAGRNNNFEFLRRDRNNNDKMDAKLDGQINSRMSAFVRLSHRKGNLFQAPEIPGPSGGDGNGFIRVLNQQLGAGFTWTTSPSSLLEIRMGLSRTRAGKEPAALGGPSMRAAYGISGLSEDPRISGGLTNQRVNGWSAFGRQATNPQWQHPFLYNPRVNYTWIIGKHSLKAGYEYQRVHTEIQDVNPLYGLDTYAGRFSQVPGSPTPTAADTQTYNLADFMFGLRDSYGLVNFFIAQYRQYMHFGYLQDDYKVSRKLTLNLGLRYEYATPQWEADNRLTNFDPTKNQLVQARSGSISDRALIDPDRNNFAPRVGLAYTPFDKTVVRAGYGVSYIHFNRSGGGNILAINGPQVVTTTVAQSPGQAGFRPTQDGYPAGITDPQNFNPITSNISYMPRESRTGYVQSWFFSIQRELLKNTVFDLAYVGNRSVKLIMFADYNQARPNGPTENTALQLRRPNQSWGPITITMPAGWASYNALQAKLEKRYSTGLYLLNSFVWSKAMDNVAQALEDPNGNGASPQNFYNLKAEKAASGYDQTFNNTSSLVWEIPFGRGRKYWSQMSSAGDHILGGWQMTAINNMWSGEPLNLRYSPAAAFQVSNIVPDWRGAIWYRPNVIGDPMTPKDQRSISNYLNRNTVLEPTDRSQPFGNSGRNTARGYAFYQLDFGLGKTFRLPGESMRLQFRSEFFNLLNKTNFRGPQVSRSSGAFGTINSAYPARQIQFGLKLEF